LFFDVKLAILTTASYWCDISVHTLTSILEGGNHSRSVNNWLALIFSGLE